MTQKNIELVFLKDSEDVITSGEMDVELGMIYGKKDGNLEEISDAEYAGQF